MRVSRNLPPSWVAFLFSQSLRQRDLHPRIPTYMQLAKSGTTIKVMDGLLALSKTREVTKDRSRSLLPNRC
jgi:hypothetical protein